MKRRERASSGRGTRDLRERVRTAKGRKISSTRWLERQLNDPYVKRARAEGFRSRSAYKLIEMNERFRFLKPGDTVVDLGSAPGGWLQVSVKAVRAGPGPGKRRGRVLGIDLMDMDPVPGAETSKLDFMHGDSDQRLKRLLGGKADVLLSDMAAPSTGHKKTDHLKIVALCEGAAWFGYEVLRDGGCFVAKVLAGGADGDLQRDLKRNFSSVHNCKPGASRADSSERYVVALGFRGRPDPEGEVGGFGAAQ